MTQDIFEGTRGDDLAAAHAGAGTEIDEIVGSAHRVFIVLDHEDGVAQVTQALQALQEAIVVARMQADAGLVEDVQDADQAGADLAREANALGFAAGEARGAAIEREIVQADVEQKPDAGADLLERLGRDQLPRFVQIERLKEGEGVANAQIADVGQAEQGRPLRSAERFAAGGNPHAAGLRIQPRPLAIGAGTISMYFSSCRRGMMFFALR